MTFAKLLPRTAEALAPLLETVRQKWHRYGAEFVGKAHEVSGPAGYALAQTFVIDDMRYQLVLDNQTQLRVQEWVQAPEHEPSVFRPVAHPRSLPFPRELKRVDRYRD